MPHRNVFALLLCFISPLVAPASAQVASHADLQIVVIAGEDAVNIIQQKTAVAPVVEVRDRNNVPVAGAVVTFTVAGGKGAAFGGASTLTVTTNAAGQAAAAGFSPVTAGAVQINVQAAFQGQVAAATIAQTNVMTAAEAAAAAATSAGGGSSGSGAVGGTGGGGGLSGTAIGGIVAGVAGAGALIAASGGNEPPQPSNNAPSAGIVTAVPSTVLLNADPVSFTAQVNDIDNDPLTYRWEFGDGNTSTEPAPRHSYTTAGTFTARLSVSDGKATTTAQTTVNVRSLTATWRSDPFPSNFGSIVMIMTLTQSGATVSGTVPVITGPTGSGGPGTLQGNVRSASPRVSLTLTFTNDGTPGRTNIYQLALDPNEDVSVLTGSIFVPITFRRQ